VAKSPDDKKLLRAIRKDCDTGMSMLVETYGGLVAYIIRQKISSVCSEYDVEECVAETFVDFYAQLEQIDLSRGSIKGYISLIARRRAIDRFNSVTRQIENVILLDEAVCAVAADDSPTPEMAAEQRETRGLLLQAVEKLGEPDSEILFRRYYLEQSLSEISEALGIKRPAVSKRIERALGKLKISMEGYI